MKQEVRKKGRQNTAAAPHTHTWIFISYHKHINRDRVAAAGPSAAALNNKSRMCDPRVRSRPDLSPSSASVRAVLESSPIWPITLDVCGSTGPHVAGAMPRSVLRHRAVSLSLFFHTIHFIASIKEMGETTCYGALRSSFAEY